MVWRGWGGGSGREGERNQCLKLNVIRVVLSPTGSREKVEGGAGPAPMDVLGGMGAYIVYSSKGEGERK